MRKTILKRVYHKSISVLFLILVCALLTFVVVQSNIFAEEKETESHSLPLSQRGIKGDLTLFQSGIEGGSGGLDGYTRVASTLLIVIALIFATVFVLKKKYGVKTNIGRGKKFINIIDYTPMGVKKSIFLVKVPGKHLLLGVTNDKIALLTEIASEDISDNGETVNKSEFLNYIKKSLSQKQI
ncbi:MAG: Flagellar biosynthesis protein, FliO [Candidatus Scalindua rubra]|uniref:Flagellar protein n=1 Tax=Candidatus Scalindua rubra TaxID=1872076 RepID=A0A1E3X585_9BACT|nr:MAG: Flagellar biosynthesis protein, FliO [Candidatus Scalindua rubra]